MFEILDEDNLHDRLNSIKEIPLSTIGFHEDNNLAYIDGELPEKLTEYIDQVLQYSQSRNEVYYLGFPNLDRENQKPPYAVLAFEEGFTMVFGSVDGDKQILLIASDSGAPVEDPRIIKRSILEVYGQGIEKAQSHIIQKSNQNLPVSLLEVSFKVLQSNKDSFIQSAEALREGLQDEQSEDQIQQKYWAVLTTATNYLSQLYSYTQCLKSVRGCLPYYIELDEFTEAFHESLKIRHVIQHNVPLPINWRITPEGVLIGIDSYIFSNRIVFPDENSKNIDHFTERSFIDLEVVVEDTFSEVELVHNQFMDGVDPQIDPEKFLDAFPNGLMF